MWPMWGAETRQPIRALTENAPANQHTDRSRTSGWRTCPMQLEGSPLCGPHYQLAPKHEKT